MAHLALDTQSEVVSDVRELVPQDLQALKDVNVLQDETGVSGELKTSLGYLNGAASLRDGAEGLIWALVNTKEFILTQ